MRFLRDIMLVAMAFAVPAGASAAVFTPNPADLDDLDHTQAYAWKIDVSTIKNSTATSAALTFRNLYNWDTNANQLFIHLFDKITTPTGGAWIGNGTNVYAFTDSPNDSQIKDAFATPPSWVVGNTFLTQFSFPGPGQTPDTTTGTANPGAQMAYTNNGTPSDKTDDRWTYTDPTGAAGSGGTYPAIAPSAGGVWTATYGDKVGSTQYYNYSYTFSATEVNILNSYIGDGWIALGLDPDCHFYNTGIELNIQTTSVPNVPEPASLLLLGSGLAALKAIRRRKQASLLNAR